ncbi:unnamed protein product [Spirodela intermedia]|uniref:Uncharacterized protein n=1 Tax=Spirodela intermedia TaxID=51605 RepID=A0ABN7EBX1_SPIIN|nr:unnamed protein product [Spirodela intermedia]
MRSRPLILGHLKKRLREGLKHYPHRMIWAIHKEKNKRKIKAWSRAFSCPRSSWRRDYLECIKIVTDQASLGLRLTHNQVCTRFRFKISILSSLPHFLFLLSSPFLNLIPPFIISSTSIYI